MKTAMIITGASRGLGAALAAGVAAADSPILAICRSVPLHGDHLVADLRQVPTFGEEVRRWVDRVDRGGSSRAGFGTPHDKANSEGEARAAGERRGAIDRWVLINNAGVLDPVGTDYTAEEAANHIAVNLTAAIVTTRLFLQATRSVRASRRSRMEESSADAPVPTQGRLDQPCRLIVNISSGAATTAYPGWSLYCTTKAALEQFGRVVAEEQKLESDPVDVLNLVPGSFASEMQDSIRDHHANVFPRVEEFRRRYRNGEIPSADEVSTRILRGLARGPFSGRRLSLDELDPD